MKFTKEETKAAMKMAHQIRREEKAKGKKVLFGAALVAAYTQIASANTQKVEMVAYNAQAHFSVYVGDKKRPLEVQVPEQEKMHKKVVIVVNKDDEGKLIEYAIKTGPRKKSRGFFMIKGGKKIELTRAEVKRILKAKKA